MKPARPEEKRKEERHVAQLTEYSPGIHEGQGVISSIAKATWFHTPVISELGSGRRDRRIRSSRLALATE